MMATYVQGRAVMTPREYGELAKEGYNKNAIAYSCISLIAEGVASIPILLYKRGRNGKLTEIERHPVLDLLKKPNPMMPLSIYMETLTSYFMLSGNFYVHAPGVDTSSKPPRELWPIRPDTIKVVPGAFAMPMAYEVQMGGTKRFPVDPTGLKPGQILHGKTFNPIDPWYGMSPIEAAAFSIDQHNEAGKWNVALLQNSARPSGAFVFKGSLRPEQRATMKADIEEKYSGSRNAGKPLVLEGDFDYKGFSFSPKDMEWIESKHTSSRDIALVFRVPPQLLGIPGDNTYSNYREARQALWIERTIPTAGRILEYHTNWLLPLFGLQDHVLGFDKDALDALTPSRDALWDRVTKSTHISTNEKRAATGYDEKPEPEYDEVLINSSQVPLTMAAEEEPAGTVDDLAEENGADVKPKPGEKPVDDEEEADPDEGKAFELKAFGARNAVERKRLWTTAQRRRKSHERRMSSQLKQLFLIEGDRVALAVQGKSGDDAMGAAKVAIDHSREDFLRVVRFNMMGIGKDFGEATLSSAKDMHLDAGLLLTKESNLRFDSYLKHWVENHAAARISNIAASTKKRIAKEIQKTFDAEEGTPELSKRLEGLYKGFAGPRATLIARTEMVSASNAATLGAAKSTGIQGLRKEWIPSDDDRSRDGDGETTNHRALEGLKVAVDAKFEVWSHDGVDLMEAPGDQSAPVDQIANCRCTLGFSKEGE